MADYEYEDEESSDLDKPVTRGDLLEWAIGLPIGLLVGFLLTQVFLWVF